MGFQSNEKLYIDINSNSSSVGLKVLCPSCHKPDSVRKAGIRCTSNQKKQMYFCNECRKKFTFHDKFYRKRFPPRLIMLAYSSRSNGATVIDIQKEIDEKFLTYVSLTTLYNWFREPIETPIFSNNEFK